MLLVGIDPGLSGGIAVLGVAGTHGRTEDKIYVSAMPLEAHLSGKGYELDPCALVNFINLCRVATAANGKRTKVLDEPIGLVLTESVRHIPINKGKGGRDDDGRGGRANPKSMFTFGDGFGQLRAAVKLQHWPLRYVTPQEWQKHILPPKVKGAGKVKASDKKKATKRAALSFVTRRFPGQTLLASPRHRTPHEGIVDALCILEYARRLMALPGSPLLADPPTSSLEFPVLNVLG